MPRIFYGWWIALATLTVYTIGGGFGFYSLTVYFAGFERAFGWSRTELSGAISLTFLFSGLLGPFAGRAADRRSAKAVIAFGILATGLSFVFLAFTNSVWQLYLAYFVMAIGRTGLNFVPLATVIANWFVRRRGLAMGLMRVGAGLGGFFIAPLSDYLITRFGLTPAFWIIALMSLAVLLPVVLAVIRQRPSDMGLLPDGERPEPALIVNGEKGEANGRAQPASISLKESLKVPTFWLLAAAIGLFFAGEVAVLMHAVPFFVDRGLTTAEATRIVSFTAVVGVGGSLLLGFLADSVLNSKYIMSICFVLQSFSLVILWFADGTLMVWAFAFAFGLSSAGILTLQGVLVGEAFGVRSFGEVFGVLSAITNVGTVAGPLIAGYLFDTTGSYQLALTIFLVVDLFAAVLILFVRPLTQTVRKLSVTG